MNWPGPDGTLREIIQRGILAIMEQLEGLRIDMQQHEEWTDVNYQVAALAEGLRDLEQRVLDLEQHKNNVSWWIGLSIAMTIGAVLAYVLGMLR